MRTILLAMQDTVTVQLTNSTATHMYLSILLGVIALVGILRYFFKKDRGGE